MTTADFYKLKDKTDDLLFAALDYALLMCPYGTKIPDRITDNTGKLLELPEGWFSIGEGEKKAGVELAPDSKVEGPEGYGSRGRRRAFVTDETFTIDFTAQESRWRTLQMFYDLLEGQYDEGTGFFAKKRRAARVREYSALVLAKDGDPGSEFYPHFIFPKITVEKRGKQSFSETDALTFPLTLAAQEDEKYGSMYGFGLAGPGFTPELAKLMGITGAHKLSDSKFKFSVKGATGGTYTITVSGKTTAAIPYNADATAVQAALRALGENEAEATGTIDAGFVIAKVSAAPTVAATDLTGGGFPKTVEVTKDPS